MSGGSRGLSMCPPAPPKPAYGAALTATLTPMAEEAPRPETATVSSDARPLGNHPNTLAEFALNQFSGQDFIDISLVDGFNIPMEFSPSAGCTRTIRCTADINGQCPAQLRTPGGCNHPCTVFKTPQHCCTSGPGTCGPTNFSRLFKERCRDAYSYPQDDPTSLFTCPGGTNYRVVFCP